MYEDQMKPAFAGMKADAGNDRVDSYPAASDLAFGVIVGKKADGTVDKGKQTKALGIALHDHLGVIKATDAVSVMTQGVAWVKVKSGVTAVEGAVKYDANGEIDTASTEALANASIKKVANGLAMVEINHPEI